MKLIKDRKYLPIKCCTLSLVGLLATLGCTVTLTAQAEIQTTVLFQPPPESEQPESTESAASRQSGQCFQDFLESSNEELASLIPIVPDSKFALTLSDRPNFWFYLPKTSAQQAILTIKEEGIKPHWQQSFNLTKDTGIVSISLADDAPALEIGKSYQWALILVCGDRPSPNDPVIVAWIKRIALSQFDQNRLQAVTSLEKAANYAEQGIWYDALDILVAEKKASISNWNEIWVKYLQSGGLDEIANEPVILND